MSYLPPSQFVPKLIDAGVSKALLTTKITLIRAFMAGAILAIAAIFAITISHQTGSPILGAALFPVGFCILILMGYDLLTGVFVLVPLALLDKRSRITIGSVLRNWFLVFTGNFLGALLVSVITSTIFTFGFTVTPDEVGDFIANIGESRTIGYKEHGIGGFITIFLRGVLCNWMVSLGVVGAFASKTVSGKIIMMWMPIMLFFGMGFEHSVVNMYLFPTAILLGGDFSITDYLLWNEIPVVLGNLLGGLFLTGLPLFYAHYERDPLFSTSPQRDNEPTRLLAE